MLLPGTWDHPNVPEPPRKLYVTEREYVIVSSAVRVLAPGWVLRLQWGGPPCPCLGGSQLGWDNWPVKQALSTLIISVTCPGAGRS